ncbi:hypothetical protein EHQ52_15425 [Leptospira koniambonensis]|uniref:TonB C-terminal domain-containing protein n=1 Tax=Leptospira koniambonensis TaxID=2484950 RepID=A0A4R9J357_9LEPT|nr:hypothetical protein [Leptospira koniambonensis]TGL31326.1 hypothetical protein EHQ52_15425 [Leptospira koniambonensis]
MKNSINVDHYDSNISGNDTMLKFQFLLSSNGKVIDTVLLCSNTSENINKEILDSVMELNFGTVPKDSLKNGPIFGIAIPYSYSF